MPPPCPLATEVAGSSSTSFFDAVAHEKQPSLFDFQFPSRDATEKSSNDEEDDDSATQRPAVLRASSAPEALTSTPMMFVETSLGSSSRPSVARACSEGLAGGGVLGRRRRARSSDLQTLPTTLSLDLAQLPKTIVTGNIHLLRAARRAVTEPREFDWHHAAATSSTKSRRHEPCLRFSIPQPAPGAILTVTEPKPAPAPTSPLQSNKRVLQNTKSCIARYWNRPACSYEDEWDWALSGNARATTEALKGSSYIEKREAVHDIWQQLPDWNNRRPSLGGRDNDLSLRGSALQHSMSPLTLRTVPERS